MKSFGSTFSDKYEKWAQFIFGVKSYRSDQLLFQIYNFALSNYSLNPLQLYQKQKNYILSEDSITGCVQLYKPVFKLQQSRLLNYLQQIISLEFLVVLTKTLDSEGPFNNLLFILNIQYIIEIFLPIKILQFSVSSMVTKEV
ncbi:hypothetical protein PPERSA_09411 [Pseudocohnilembus persalinus]|uniref:Uncharacterized protein n=1 Tax=Pseudocohnilembus persalinus TaxID=266149 RepID=A0A0V0Q9K4_PSEPJ|nr:hypothetical protein PPERSA_09411 [Pseudocohnilembus persalinus]|eukprot:KRW98886.1 hypothetical protein PPERSA_09411 [Pseudocohnilembus persalinus]